MTEPSLTVSILLFLSLPVCLSLSLQHTHTHTHTHTHACALSAYLQAEYNKYKTGGLGKWIDVSEDGEFEIWICPRDPPPLPCEVGAGDAVCFT